MSHIIEDVVLDALDEASTIARAECEEVDYSPSEHQWNEFARRLRAVARAGVGLTAVDDSSEVEPPRKRFRLCPRTADRVVPHDDRQRGNGGDDAPIPMDPEQLGERISLSVQPPCRAANLAEASHAALCSGRAVASRKPQAPADTKAVSPPKRGVMGEVTTAAVNERRLLYTGGLASEVDLLTNIPITTSTPPLPTPAAVRHSELNFRVECAALERQIHVDTKLALLRSIQPLREKIAQLKQRRESLYHLAHASSVARSSGSIPWISVEAADQGVCSLVFRGALRVVLLWDGQGQRWNVRDAEWLWKARVAPSGSSGALDALSANGSYQIAPVWLLQQAPVVAHLRRVFSERGFVEGCLAAISAVAGLWMELCDQQTSWLVGELAETLVGAGSPTTARISVQLDTQVNSGFISVFFTTMTPSTSEAERDNTADGDRVAAVVNAGVETQERKGATPVQRTSTQTKWLVSDGTVYRITQLGTDLTSRVVVDVLDELASQLPRNRIVDIEPTLWSDWLCALQMARKVQVGHSREL